MEISDVQSSSDEEDIVLSQRSPLSLEYDAEAEIGKWDFHMST